jgi:methionyl-tRNA formyltransferase
MSALFVRTIAESHHELAGVIQNGRELRGIHRRWRPWLASKIAASRSVAGFARSKGLPVVWIDKMTETELEPLRRIDPDLLLVGGFSVILKRPLIELPRIGCVNCHSSLLPAHRGPNPFLACVLANEPESGVTFHVIDEGIDSGAILRQYAIPIRDNETAGSLFRRCARLANDHLLEVLNDVESNGLRGTPQDESKASYDQKLKDADLYIDWTRPARDIERLTRAAFPFMLARCRYRGKTVYISKAKVDPQTSGAPPGQIIANRPRLRIATPDGTIVLVAGYMTRPVPWFWPRFFRRPQIGERME